MNLLSIPWTSKDACERFLFTGWRSGFRRLKDRSSGAMAFALAVRGDQLRRPGYNSAGRFTLHDGDRMKIGHLCFPSDAEVAAEEAARFRASAPAERMRAIRSALNAGAALIACSPRRSFLEAYRQQQEDLSREMISNFVKRHAGHP